MAIPFIDLSNVIKWFGGSGTGTPADPYILQTTGGGGGGGGDASAANQTTEITKLTSIDGKTPALGQAVAGSSVPVVLPAAQITTLTPPAAITGYSTETTLAAQTALMGAVNETAPATDTASSGHNGRLQRIAQRLTSLIALLPTALGSTTAANSFPVTLSSDGPFSILTGAVTETAPATDTVSSGVNGRLQRIAQRLTSLIALFPTSLTGNGNFKVAIQENTAAATASTTLQTAATATGNGSTGSVDGYATALFAVSGITTATVTFEASNDAGATWVSVLATLIGGTTIATTATADGYYRIAAAGLKLVRARISAYTSGTITVTLYVTTAATSNKVIDALQTGTWNITNVSGTVSLPTGAATAAKQPALGTAGSASTDVITVQGIASGTAQPVSIALPTVVYNGLTNVTTAGTRVVLASSQAILSGVTIKAKAANTGTIYVGSSTVSSANGYALAPGDSVFLEIANLNTVNIDSSVNGEGVTYIAT